MKACRLRARTRVLRARLNALCGRGCCAAHHRFSTVVLEPIIAKRASIQIALVPKSIEIKVRRGMLRHVVLFQWNEDVGDREISSVCQGSVSRFAARVRASAPQMRVRAARDRLSLLPEEIPQVVNYFYGSDLGLKKAHTDSDFVRVRVQPARHGRSFALSPSLGVCGRCRL